MSERDSRLYLTDIQESGNAILEFTKGMPFEAFRNDRKTCSAVIREFEIIGEAVRKIPDDLKIDILPSEFYVNSPQIQHFFPLTFDLLP